MTVFITMCRRCCRMRSYLQLTSWPSIQFRHSMKNRGAHVTSCSQHGGCSFLINLVSTDETRITMEPEQPEEPAIDIEVGFSCPLCCALVE